MAWPECGPSMWRNQCGMAAMHILVSPATAGDLVVANLCGYWMPRRSLSSGRARARTRWRGMTPSLFRRLQRHAPFRREPKALRALEQEAQRRPARQPEQHQRTEHAGKGDDHRHQTDIGNEAGLEQEDAGGGHEQEEGEVDDYGMLAA